MDGVAGATSAAANEKLDESEQRKNIIVLAATNRPWDLDDALIRRLEKRIHIPLPTEFGRESLFKINLKEIQLDSSIDWSQLVAKTEGYSGADIANVCRDAAMMPMRRRLVSGNFGFNLDDIQKLEREVEIPLTMQDFTDAIKNI